MNASSKASRAAPFAGFLRPYRAHAVATYVAYVALTIPAPAAIHLAVRFIASDPSPREAASTMPGQ